jgi:hypothetical protein
LFDARKQSARQIVESNKKELSKQFMILWVHVKELLDLQRPHITGRTVKSNTIRWAANVARMGETWKA